MQATIIISGNAECSGGDFSCYSAQISGIYIFSLIFLIQATIIISGDAECSGYRSCLSAQISGIYIFSLFI